MYSKRSGIRRKAVKGGFLPMFAPMMGMMGNPMEMIQKMNPLNMLMGKGVINPQYQYSGGSVVNPQYQYKGGAVVHPQYQYKGGMSAGEFFNPMTSPLSPLSWAKKMFGGGQVGGGMVGGKKKRSSVRGQKVAELMRTRGMTLGEASKHLKNMGE
jgi:hypothetical protein